MRTLLFLVAGLLLMSAFLILGKLFTGQYSESARVATFAFVAVWFVVAGCGWWSLALGGGTGLSAVWQRAVT